MKTTLKLFLAVAVILFLSSCKGPQPKENAEEKAAYEAAMNPYLKGDAPAAIAGFTQFIQSYPKSRNCAQAYYFRGKVHLAGKNYSDAEADFNMALKIGKPKSIKGYALAGLGDLYLVMEQFEQACHYYRKALRSYSKDLEEDVVLYNLGKATQRNGRWHEADRYFIKLCNKYPDSEFCPRAREKMASEERYFSVQVGAFDEEKNALTVGKKLADAGYNVFIKEKGRGGKSRFCVRVGKFKNWHEARRMQDRLKGEKHDTLIVP